MPTEPDAARSARLAEAGQAYAAALSDLADARAAAVDAAVDARLAGWPVERISAALGVTRATATKWLQRAAER